VLTIHGVDLQMVFPHPVRLKTPNLYIRTHPLTLLSDPYALGWLFEGTLVGDDPATAAKTVRRELVSGRAAAEWIESEMHRVSHMAHALSNAPDLQGEVAMADGGTVERGFIRHLNRDGMLRVFNEFFSPFAEWRDAE